jgi:hypothetical protein
MSSSCIYRAHELIEFIKNLKKYTCFFHPTSSIIKFQFQTHYSLSITKREISDSNIKFQFQTHYSLSITKREISDRFLTLNLSEILSFLLLLHY